MSGNIRTSVFNIVNVEANARLLAKAGMPGEPLNLNNIKAWKISPQNDAPVNKILDLGRL